MLLAIKKTSFFVLFGGVFVIFFVTDTHTYGRIAYTGMYICMRFATRANIQTASNLHTQVSF